MSECPTCHSGMTWIPQYQQWYCYACRQYRQPATPPATAGPQQAVYATPAAEAGLWFQDFYRVRKKVLAIAQQYWIEDYQGRQLAYSKQKLLAFKENIRVCTDQTMAQELFRIQQTNWTDAWGNFAVIDSATNTTVGYVRRKAIMSAIRDEWELYDPWQRLIGGIYQSGGNAFLQRFVPGGSLAPSDMTITLNGQPIAKINQQFKVIGDVWEISCHAVPAHFDRRVLLACAILMGIIERDRK